MISQLIDATFITRVLLLILFFIETILDSLEFNLQGSGIRKFQEKKKK